MRKLKPARDTSDYEAGRGRKAHKLTQEIEQAHADRKYLIFTQYVPQIRSHYFPPFCF